MTLNNLREGSSPPFWYVIQGIAESIFTSPIQNGHKKRLSYQHPNEPVDATEGVIMINGQGEIVQLSASAAVLFSYCAAELQGRPIQVLIPGADFWGSRPVNSSLRPEGYIARKKNGVEFRSELMVSYSQRPQDQYAFIWVSAINLH